MRCVLLAAAILHIALGGAALACGADQKGNTIFEDTFADDSGGWDLQMARIQPPNLIFSLGERGKQALNLTFNATDGDYCVDVLLPADTSAYAGLIFWASDFLNLYFFRIGSSGNAGLWRLVNNQWANVFKVEDAPVEPTNVNHLRVMVEDGLITMFVNGKEIRKVRAQTPPGLLRFGLRAEPGKAMSGTFDVKFQNFKVTSGG